MDVAKLQADFSRQVGEAVEKAVAESDARHERRTAELLTTATHRFEAKLMADKAAAFQNLAIMDKYALRDYRASMFPEGSR